MHDDHGPDEPGGDLEDVPVLDEAMLPEIVTELAATSERHARHLSTVDGRVAGLDRRLAAQASELAGLDETVKALEESLTEKVNLARPSRWAWEFLTRDEARQLWRETRWFVDYLIGRYPLAGEVSIPPCWYRHTVAVDELSDLYAAWREAYCSGDRPSAAMTAWRDRWLWPTLHRLATFADWRECKERRQHVTPTARQDRTDEQFAEFVKADLAPRPVTRSRDLPWPAKSPRR